VQQIARRGAAPRSAADAAIAFLICVVAAILLYRTSDPLGVRADSWSEAEVLISGMGYVRSGFVAFAALPQHQPGPPVDPYFLYANYPVLSNVLNGVLRGLGADGPGWFRLPAIAASLLAIWLWYRLVARVIDRPTAAAATLALASSFGFLAYADNIHQQAYPLAPQLGALLCLVIGVAPETRHRGRWLLGCSLCLLLVSLFTIELHLWLLIAIAGYVLLFGASVHRRWLLLLALPLGAGLALQWLQGQIGSPVPPEDRPSFTENLYRRSIGFDEAMDTPFDATGQPITVATYPRFILGRFAEFYLLPMWVVPLLLLPAYIGSGPPTWRPTRWPAELKLLAILLAAPLGWMCTMMQQTAVHPATMRQFLPFYALLLGVLWTQCVRGTVDARHHWLWRGALALAVVATLVPHCQATWSNLRMHSDHAYIHPLILEPGWPESEDLGRLRGMADDGVILTNHNRAPLIRYWSGRPTYLAPNYLATMGGSESNWLLLTLRYLRELYPTQPPRILYLYQIDREVPDYLETAMTDPLLRLLTTGDRAPIRSRQALQDAGRALDGRVPAACPILAGGTDWRLFDMTPIMPILSPSVDQLPAPTLKDMPPPR
jgi:hypothetical protein